MLVYGECECVVMQMLYVCVLCVSCGCSQCCVLHDLQFANAGRGCNRRPYRRDTTSTHYKTADTDIQHCIQYITNIPHSVLTGDVIAHSTLWHSYIDDHRGQLIADGISNSDHITLNTNTPTRVPNTTLQQTSSPDITLWNASFKLTLFGCVISIWKEDSSPVSAITERMDIGLYEVPLSMYFL